MKRNPVQAKYAIAAQRDCRQMLRRCSRIASKRLPDDGEKINVTPEVGHELFKIGTLTDKVPQFHLLAAGNPRPETTCEFRRCIRLRLTELEA